MVHLVEAASQQPRNHTCGSWIDYNRLLLSAMLRLMVLVADFDYTTDGSSCRHGALGACHDFKIVAVRRKCPGPGWHWSRMCTAFLSTSQPAVPQNDYLVLK